MSLDKDPVGGASAIAKLGARGKRFARQMATVGIRARGQEMIAALKTLGLDRGDLQPLIVALGQAYPAIVHEDWERAREVLLGIGRAAAPAAEDIMGLLESEHPRTRAAAAACPATIGKPEAEGAVPALRKLYCTDERRVRYEAGRALQVLLGHDFLRREPPWHGQ